MGQFEPQHDAMVLLVVVGEVLRSADPRAPERVSQRRYDAARRAAGHPDTPRADKLAARFGISWPDLRDRVLHADDPAKAVALAAKTQTRRVLTSAAAVSAVSRVAARLGVSELSPAEYERGRLDIDASARRSHKHGVHFLPMPSAAVIEQAHGFKSVLEAAGLALPDPTPTPLLSRADAVVAFVEHFGFQPRRLDIEWMARHHGIQLVMITKDAHSPAVAAARARFETAGRWFPLIASVRARPDEWQHLGNGEPGLTALALAHPRKRTRGEGYTLDDLRDAIARAYDLMPRGQRLTADRYRTIGRKHGLPSYKTLHARAKLHDVGFVQLVRDEATRRAEQVRAARP